MRISSSSTRRGLPSSDRRSACLQAIVLPFKMIFGKQFFCWRSTRMYLPLVPCVLKALRRYLPMLTLIRLIHVGVDVKPQLRRTHAAFELDSSLIAGNVQSIVYTNCGCCCHQLLVCKASPATLAKAYRLVWPQPAEQLSTRRRCYTHALLIGKRVSSDKRIMNE